MRKNVVIALAVISFLILAIVALWNYREPSYNTFGIDNFYQPDVEKVLDPKRTHDKYNRANIFDQKSCLSEMTSQANPITVYGTIKYWISSDRTRYSDLEITNNFPLQVCVNEEINDKWYQIYSDGDMIVAPATVTFINSNNVTDENGLPYIDIYVGDYRIKFSKVKSWWCHIGKDSSRHTKLYGKGGAYSSANPGYILGEATASTEVRIYKKSADGKTFEQSSLEDFYSLIK